MIDYYLYDLKTGEFNGRSFSSSSADDAFIAANTPDGFGTMPGFYDPLRQRVNVATGEVETWESPQIEIQARQRKVDAARAAIVDLEARQARAVREALISPNAETLDRLSQLDQQIAQQRQIINGL